VHVVFVRLHHQGGGDVEVPLEPGSRAAAGGAAGRAVLEFPLRIYGPGRLRLFVLIGAGSLARSGYPGRSARQKGFTVIPAGASRAATDDHAGGP